MNKTVLTAGISGLLLLTAAAVGIFAASSGDKTGRVFTDRKTGKTVIELTVDCLPDPAGTDARTRLDRALTEKFVAGFPAIFKAKYAEKYKRDPKKYGKFDWDDVEIRLKTLAAPEAKGNPGKRPAVTDPDHAVFCVDLRNSDVCIRNGLLRPLNEFIERLSPEERKRLLEERIHPKIMPAIYRQGPDGGKYYWAVPCGAPPAFEVLMYRRDLFERRRISCPSADWTWEQLLDACRKLTAPGTYGILLGRGAAESRSWFPFLRGAGGDVMKQNAAGQWRYTFNSESGARAADFYLRLSAEKWTDARGQVRRGCAAKNSAPETLWARGAVGLRIVRLDEKTVSGFDPERCGITPLPLGPPDEQGRRRRGTGLFCTMLGMSAAVTDPVIRDAAWEYMYYRNSEEGLRLRMKILAENGLDWFAGPDHPKRSGPDNGSRQFAEEFRELRKICLDDACPAPFGENIDWAENLMSMALHLLETKALADTLAVDPKLRMEQIRRELQLAEANANKLIGAKPNSKWLKYRNAQTHLNR